MRPDRFAAITGRDSLPQVLEGIDAAVSAGLDPVKVNCVLVRGVNDDEIVDFAAFGRERGVEVRFIEWMPLDGGGAWAADRVVPARRSSSAIDAVWPLVTEDGRRVSQAAPAESYRYADGRGRVGVIASVTRPFCERATGSASPPRASCATACSPCGRPTCGPSCVAGAATTTWRRRSRPRSAGSGPATRSARSTSSAPRAA